MALLDRIIRHYYPRMWERRSWRGAPPASTAILMYHEVLPDSLDRPYWHVVSESEFRSQLQYFQQHYDVVSLDDALAAHSASKPSDGKPRIAITFDDGYAGNVRTAMPILEEFEMPFTVYIATSKIHEGGVYWYDVVVDALFESGRSSQVTIETSAGPIEYRDGAWLDSHRWASVNAVLSSIKRLPAEERNEIASRLERTTETRTLSMMTPEETGRLAAEPLATVGCHTHNHDLLDTIPVEEARTSIERAQQLLTEWCGNRPEHFSYPNGNYTREIVDLVRDLGFRSAVTTENRLCCPEDDSFLFPRIAVGRFDNLNMIRAKIAGVLTDKPGNGR